MNGRKGSLFLFVLCGAIIFLDRHNPRDFSSKMPILFSILSEDFK
jgi:hypothetical protein